MKTLLFVSIIATFFISRFITENRMRDQLRNSMNQTRDCIYMLEESTELLHRNLKDVKGPAKKKSKKFRELNLGITTS